MRGDTAFLHTIDRLYTAALEPAAWPDALVAVADLALSDHVILVERGSLHGISEISFGRADERSVAQSLAAQRWCDPGPLATLYPPGVPWTRTAIQPDREFRRSAYYNEVVRPLNGFYSMQALHATASASFIAVVCRTPRDDDFDAGAMGLLKQLLPHLGNALEILLRFGALQTGNLALAGALDGLSGGVVVVDAAARPTFVNAAAQTLLSARDGLRIARGGRLAASGASATLNLRQTIAQLAEYPPTCPAARLAMPRAMRPPLLVRLMPLATGPGGGRVAMFLTDTAKSACVDRSVLMDCLRLTPREADIAALVADGLDPQSIAAALGLGVSTVRFHLKHAFEKTGSHNQVAFAALIRAFAQPFH